MRKSKATMHREAEIQKKREIIIENSNLAAAEEEFFCAIEGVGAWANE